MPDVEVEQDDKLEEMWGKMGAEIKSAFMTMLHVTPEYDRSIVEPYVMAADEEVQDIDEYVQELSLVKFLGIESRQPLVTDVDGEALAIADGVRESASGGIQNGQRHSSSGSCGSCR